MAVKNTHAQIMDSRGAPAAAKRQRTWNCCRTRNVIVMVVSCLPLNCTDSEYSLVSLAVVSSVAAWGLVATRRIGKMGGTLRNPGKAEIA